MPRKKGSVNKKPTRVKITPLISQASMTVLQESPMSYGKTIDFLVELYVKQQVKERLGIEDIGRDVSRKAR